MDFCYVAPNRFAVYRSMAAFLCDVIEEIKSAIRYLSTVVLHVLKRLLSLLAAIFCDIVRLVVLIGFIGTLV